MSDFCCFPRDFGWLRGNHKNRNPICMLLWALGRWNRGCVCPFRAVLGVVPKLQEILTVFRRYLESSGWPLELAVTQSGLELQSGGRPSGVRASSELGQKGRSGAAGCRRSSDKSTCPSALCPGSPGLRLASSLCHCAVSQGCPAGQIH